MVVGYVSDERFVALCDVAVEFEQNGVSCAVVRTTPRGAVTCDLPDGTYRVTLVKDGYGSKVVHLEVRQGMAPYQFRLLSNRMVGYMWPKWVVSGQRSEFRVHSTSPFRLSLYRYGLTQEFVKIVGWLDEHGPGATVQVTPDGDYTQTGIRFNSQGYSSSPHHTQFVAGPERSGLYYLHAENEAGEFFSFPWVVAPAKPTCNLAVLASTNNWNAYNNFGGRSNYINAAGLPSQPVVSSRLEMPRYQDGAFSEWGAALDAEFPPLSFERPELGCFVPRDEQPTNPIRGRLASSLAPAEWRLVAWLEREGESYDYYSDAQLHDGTLDLDAYQALIIAVHPEYWSRTMYERVRDWVNRGGRLLYLGGNGINCEVEFVDAGRLHFKTHLRAEGGELGMRNPLNPSEYWESRFHRTVEPEATLLGVVSTDTGIMTGAPYRALMPDHWLFNGTGLREGDLFGTECLHERCSGGASGHETDKLSKYAPPGAVVIAKGLNPDDGGAEIVYQQRASGGSVFSVGSINYCASLLVDDGINRLTLNALHHARHRGGV